MAGNIFGYIRVSTADQNEDRQLLAMRKLSIPERNIYTDKQSGKDFQRVQYQKMAARLRRDDLLYIKSIDRLGRNYTEILDQWGTLTKTRGIDIVVLDMPLQVLPFAAENERRNIRQRQAEGIAAAKARGVKFGRPAKPLPENFPAIHRQWRQKQLTLHKAAEACGMPEGTFYAKAVRYENAPPSPPET